MRARDAVAVAAALCTACAASCAGSQVPPEKRPKAEEALVSGVGARSYVQVLGGGAEVGELIAVDGRQLWLLDLEGRLKAIPLQEVQRAWFGVFRTYEGSLAAWTVLGSLSTASHGAWLIFSLPIWLVTGISSTVQESGRGLVTYPDSPPDFIRMYARFPQGLPPGVGAAELLGQTLTHAPAPREVPAREPAPATAPTQPPEPAPGPPPAPAPAGDGAPE